VNRHLTAFCESSLGRAINMACLFGIAAGLFASSAIALALVFGHASATALGLALIATGGCAFLYIVTE
jgi:hypothetical protein